MNFYPRALYFYRLMPLKDIFMGKELFDNIPNKVVNLLMDVKNGRVGLPDLQRPFVWKDNKVRDLLDSMMKGYLCLEILYYKKI